MEDRLWEIPAGLLEPGEDALVCAKRELLEETGYTGDAWREALSFFTTPGFSNERITLYFADGLHQAGQPDPDEIEACEAFSLEELGVMLDAGQIRDAKTALAILLYRSRLRTDPTPEMSPHA